MTRRVSGAWGWLGLAGFVFAYDTIVLAHGQETLTSAFGRAMQHPVRRWPVVALWGVTTLHLFGVLPRSADPFHLYAKVLHQVRYRS